MDILNGFIYIAVLIAVGLCFLRETKYLVGLGTLLAIAYFGILIVSQFIDRAQIEGVRNYKTLFLFDYCILIYTYIIGLKLILKKEISFWWFPLWLIFPWISLSVDGVRLMRAKHSK